eukprot:TRINITY_DN1982_c0_g1_i2.p1 TRINITY_DN1982_c0_g1~~TRINITY_DN1982_c0_g1_i2.p1  ORF type:complete len:672 (+),score=116.18 TRINITY_DN1982_c0_g1_i2:331-2346(+)
MTDQIQNVTPIEVTKDSTANDVQQWFHSPENQDFVDYANLFGGLKGSRVLGLSKEDMVDIVENKAVGKALWNALHPITKITWVDDEGKALKKRKLDNQFDESLTPTPVVNGRVLKEERHELVVHRNVEQYIREDVAFASFIIGPFMTGKTNLMACIAREYEKCGVQVIWVTLQGLYDKESLDEIITNLYEKVDGIRKLMNNVANDSPLIDKLRQVSSRFPDAELSFCLCIDEGHKVMDQSDFHLLVQILTRVYQCKVFLASVAYEYIVSPKENYESPFERFIIRDIPFNEDEIKEAIIKLQGKKHQYVELPPELIESIVNEILDYTHGHTGLCGLYFYAFHLILKDARENFLSVEAIEDRWRSVFDSDLSKIEHENRLARRIPRGIKEIWPHLIENSILLDKDNTIPYSDEDWINNSIATGILEFVDINEEEPLLHCSCPAIKDFVLNCKIYDVGNRKISDFIVEGELNLISLAKWLLENTSIPDLNVNQSWVTSRIKKSEYFPSEKQYQILWFNLLRQLCRSDPNWHVSQEALIDFDKKTLKKKHKKMNMRQDMRVDLMIVHMNEEERIYYQIELVCNGKVDMGKVNKRGYDDSVPGHALRQKLYHDLKKNTRKSLIVSIYNHTVDNPYHPSKKHRDIDFIHVEHFLTDFSTANITVNGKSNEIIRVFRE